LKEIEMSKSNVLRTLVLAASLAIAGTTMSAPASAQVPALLPSVGEMKPSAPLPIDGMYTIREIDKRIMVQDGYAYAVDGWVHALIFQIMPDQVIVRDIQPLPDGSFVGDDLPLMAKIKIEPQPDGSLIARTVTGLPAVYHLDPVGYGAPPAPPAPPSAGWGPGSDPGQNPDAGQPPVDPWAH
jgi:hypothetical protein